MRSPRRALAVMVAAMALVGCSGERSTVVQDQGPVPAGPAAFDGEALAPSDARYESLAAFYEEFLAASDRHRVGAGDPGSSGLANLAAPAVVAEADAWRVANQARGEGFDRVVALDSSANIAAIEVSPGGTTLVDCTRVAETWVGGELSEHGPTLDAYESRVVEISEVNGQRRVELLEVTHAGTIDAPGYGCVPEELGAQAASVVKETLIAAEAAKVDPRDGIPPELATLVADPFEAELSSDLAELATQSFAIASPSQVSSVAEGIDPRGLGEEVVVVSACVSYPEGLELAELGSGEVVRQVFAPGTAAELVLAVRLGGPEGPEVYQLVSETLPAQC